MAQTIGALNPSALQRIPDELKQLKQWAPFKISPTGKKSPVAGFTVNDPSSWLTFDEVSEQCTEHKYLAAFVLTDSDPYVVLDLDSPKADNPNASQIANDHLELIKILGDTYTELSQSGQGYHVWLKGNLTKAVNNRLACTELYTTGRFIICTGTNNSQPILADQETVDGLYDKFKLRQETTSHFINQPQDYTDDELYNQCLARFPDRFATLYTTPTDPNSQTKSEDDFALIAMICEFSNNRDQIHRLFFNSKRPRRKHYLHPENYITRAAGKAQKHINKTETVSALLKNMKAPPARADVKIPPVEPTPPPANLFEVGYPEPLGLLKELMDYCLLTAPYPDKDVALAGALSFMSGIVGRRYTLQGSALNLYIVILAPSSHGKSAASNLCDKLANELANPVNQNGGPQSCTPDAHKFFQSHIRSAPGLYKNVLPKQQSFTWIIDEIGLVERGRKQRGNSNGGEIQAALLELYSATSAGGHIVSEKSEQPVPRVSYPAVSLLGNSVEEVMFDTLDEESFSGGTFGRYHFIVIRRDKPYQRYATQLPIDPTFRQKLFVLLGQGLQSVGEGMSNNIQCVKPLGMTDAAVALQRTFSNEFIDKYNAWNRRGGVGHKITGALYGRLSHKVTKLAGLHAVSRYGGDDRMLLDTTLPIVDEVDVQWAVAFVRHEMAVLDVVSSEGSLSLGQDEKRVASLMKALREDMYGRPVEQWSSTIREKTETAFRAYGAITKSAMHFIVKSKSGWKGKAVEESAYRSFGEMLQSVLKSLVDQEELICTKVGNGEYYWLPEYYPTNEEKDDE